MTKIVYFGDPDVTSDAEAVLTQAVKENADLYVFLGDGGYNGKGKEFVDLLKKYFSDKLDKLVIVLGNHDDGESESDENEELLGELLPAQKSEKWITKWQVGDIFLSVMNSQDMDIEFKDRDQFAKVTKHIEEAKKLRAEGKIKFIVNAVHKPWFTLKSSHSPYTAVREIYSDLFKNVVNKNKHGHNHNDQSWYSMIAIKQDGNAAGQQLQSFLADGKTIDHSKEHGWTTDINGHSGHEHNKFKENATANKNVQWANDSKFSFNVDESNDQGILNSKWKDVSGNVLYEYNISQTGTIVDPGHNCKSDEHWDEALQKCVKNTPTDPVDTVDPTCPAGYDLKTVNGVCKCVKRGTNPNIPKEECLKKKNFHWDEAKQQCIPNPFPPFKKCPHGQHWDYNLNECVPNTEPEKCPVGQHWSSAENRCVPDVVDPGTGEIDSNGVKWIVAKGKQSVIKQSRDEATDDRWSGNVTGLMNGFEATFYGKSIGTNSSSHFAMKQFSGNHSGSGANKNAWYDTGLRVDGTIQLQTEFPHPNNHDFSLSDQEQFIKKISKGLEGNMIALKWCVMLVKPNGTRKDGIRCRMWVDEDPIGADGKPKNDWKLVYDFVDTGQIIPSDKQLVDEQDCEVRRSDTDEHEVLFGGLNVRQL